MFPILYEDDAVFVIDKPVGMPCNRQKNGRWSVADLMVERFPDLAHVGSIQDAGLVHRLDNDTSGCLMVARSPEAYRVLRQQFGSNAIYKTYRAVVIGHPPATGRCDVPIIHDPGSTKRMRCAHPGETGQPAHTEWKVLYHYPISTLGPAGYTHLQIRITTGVRHQIRVHMAHRGYPLAGDRMYQSRKQRACDRLGVPHHLLHASDIGFVSPATGRKVTCTAPLPPHFSQTLKTLDETKKRR